MRIQFTKTALAASLVLTLAFMLNSCGGDNNGEDPSSSSADVDKPSSSSGSSSSNMVFYTDKGNDIAKYKTVKIGEQTWMAENLNYNVSGSKCNGEGGRIYMGHDKEKDKSIYITLSAPEIQANCDKYGRLYNWATAMNLPSKCNSTLSASDADCAIETSHRGVCPSGWHIPSNEDWVILAKYADPNWTSNIFDNNVAGTKLKAENDWSEDGNGTDDFGFKALPGGGGSTDGFQNVGRNGWWHNSSDDDQGMHMHSYDIIFSVFDDFTTYKSSATNTGVGKSALLSVRCIMD